MNQLIELAEGCVMRWSALSGVAFAIGFSSFAYADGLPERYREPAYVPAFTWTGCYLGGHLGSGWGRKDWADDKSDTSLLNAFTVSGRPADQGTHETTGVLAGVQGGCDYQVSSHLVIGAQADFSWANLKGEHTKADSFTSPPIFFATTFTANTKVDRLGTITGRLGYASERALFYVKGGGAWVHDNHSMAFTDANTVPVTAGMTGDADVTRWGWTVGVGFEYTLSTHVSAFIGYDYLNFGRDAIQFSCANLTNIPSCNTGAPLLDVDQQIHQIKLGMNYRF
jgi:outer membrane immunogenic protein